MKTVRISSFLLCATIAMSAIASPLKAVWHMGTNGARAGWYSSRFVLTNVAPDTLRAADWTFYFNQFSRRVELPTNCPVDIKEVSTTYFQVSPRPSCRDLAPGDTLVVDMLMRGTMLNISYSPMGGHVVMNKTGEVLPVKIEIAPLEKPGQWQNRPNDYPDGNRVYDFNATINAVNDAYTANDYDIFPTPKQVVMGSGYTTLGGLVKVKAGWLLGGKDAKKAARLLKSELLARGIYSAGGGNTTIKVKINKSLSENPEYYTLSVNDGKIEITGAALAGAQNGVKTLIAAIDHCRGGKLQNAEVVDWPDLNYRGFMLDVARNFTTFENVKRFIDILAYYKINTFQFHVTDDEAWRVEIPGLPELTEVASRRGHTLDEKQFLAQIYDGNGNPDDLTQSANGYYTRQQFIELLRYADARGVRVIPEIETPGHARAAIIAMKARHERLKDVDPVEANRYRLWDDEDTSDYYSAQAYTDNVLNVAQDGVYNFVAKVVDELMLMYKEAGLKLTVVHLGGDEVAKGAWDRSPAVQALMAREGLDNAHRMHEYYVRRVSDLMVERGIKIEGWQEVAQGHDEAWSKVMRERIAGVNAWSTVGARAAVPVEIANDGYPVIMSNVTNFYMDMGHTWHQDEPGLHWGGAVDEFKAWEAQPFNIYRTARQAFDGTDINLATIADGKPALVHPENIIGVQGQLWAETVRNFGMVQRYVLPKVFGVVERGWNARPEWGEDYTSDARYIEARHQYNLKIGTRELPLLRRMGYNFHLLQPGLKVENGHLLANAAYPGVVITYTTDGSDPTISSTAWTAPVAIPKGVSVIKARAWYCGEQSVATYLWLNK